MVIVSISFVLVMSYALWTVREPIPLIVAAISSIFPSQDQTDKMKEEELKVELDDSDAGFYSSPFVTSDSFIPEEEEDDIEKIPRVNFKWQLGNKIGAGQFGSAGQFGNVYSSVNLDTGELMAVKKIRVIPHDYGTIKEIADGITNIQGVQHDSLVKYFGVELHKDEMLIFMEFCASGTIAEISKLDLPESIIRVYTHQITKAINFLHENGIIHRDIKGDNTFVSSSGLIKIGDFSSAVKLNDATKGEVFSTRGTADLKMSELMNFKDLKGVGSSPHDVSGKFDDKYGKSPDGICVNNEGYYDYYTPIITESYGHPCYKKLGQYEFQRESATTDVHKAVIGSNTAVNHGDAKASIQLTVNGSWSESTGYSSSITTGMSFSTEFGVEGVFKMGAEFSLSVTAGKSSSSSVSRSSTASVTVEVPPRSKVKVNMVALMKKEKLGFKVPIEVQGMFGANFPDKVHDHYFWFMDARDALPTTTGEISGIIEGTRSFNVNTEIGKAESV